jgi:hypothetical protein
MGKSQSESPLVSPLKVRGARGVMQLDHAFAEGKRTMPGPGKNSHCFSSLRGAQRRSNLEKGQPVMRQA